MIAYVSVGYGRLLAVLLSCMFTLMATPEWVIACCDYDLSVETGVMCEGNSYEVTIEIDPGASEQMPMELEILLPDEYPGDAKFLPDNSYTKTIQVPAGSTEVTVTVDAIEETDDEHRLLLRACMCVYDPIQSCDNDWFFIDPPGEWFERTESEDQVAPTVTGGNDALGYLMAGWDGGTDHSAVYAKVWGNPYYDEDYESFSGMASAEGAKWKKRQLYRCTDPPLTTFDIDVLAKFKYCSKGWAANGDVQVDGYVSNSGSADINLSSSLGDASTQLSACAKRR